MVPTIVTFTNHMGKFAILVMADGHPEAIKKALTDPLCPKYYTTVEALPLQTIPEAVSEDYKNSNFEILAVANFKELTEETIYNLYNEHYPAIVQMVKKFLATGFPPDKIHKHFQKKLGNNSATAAHIGLVADYLKRTQNQKNNAEQSTDSPTKRG